MFPITHDGLVVDALVNLEAPVLISLWQSGKRPLPLAGRALIDTGSDKSAVSAPILQTLGVPTTAQATTTGITGTILVNLFRVSLHVFDSQNPQSLWITSPTLEVMELPPTVPFDVLIGMDIVRLCRIVINGVSSHFTIEHEH